MLDPVRLYNPSGPDRSAVISAEPSGSLPGGYLIRLARGKSGTAFGPFMGAELPARFAEAVDTLRGEGFVPAGLPALLERLDRESPRSRALAALRLGWKQCPEAVQPILDRLPQAAEEACSYMDALGRLGDPAALPGLLEQAKRKLLSRRRSAAEAVRNIGDAAAAEEVRSLALARLPESPRHLIATETSASELFETFAKEKLPGLIADTLYEIGTPVCVAAAMLWVDAGEFAAASRWRYVKSILKRSMLRGDYETFGKIVHAVERRGRSETGTGAVVKSGRDGQPRYITLFGRATQNYIRRNAWRHLEDVARYRPADYAHAAAACLAPYDTDDADAPAGLLQQYARCFLYHRILFGGRDRFTLDKKWLIHSLRSAKLAVPPANVREEAHPHRWDAEPRAYLRLLAAARLPEVHEFALRAVEKRHPELLHAATVDDLAGMLAAPYEATVGAALTELDRRFDAGRPDWGLIDRLLAMESGAARDVALVWLRLTSRLWPADPGRAVALLASPRPDVRDAVLGVLRSALVGLPEARAGIAERLIPILGTPEPAEGAHAGYTRLARESLGDELNQRLTVVDLIKWLKHGPLDVKGLAGDLLGRRDDALNKLGIDAVIGLAEDDIVLVRGGAQNLIRRASFVDDPAPLLTLAESQWGDNRAVAFELLRRVIDVAEFRLDELITLADSNRVDVQDIACELIRKRLPGLPVLEVLRRASEHPHANMRRFVMELAVRHLPDGAEALRSLWRFFKAAMFDLQPDRGLKRAILALLEERAFRDADQAEAAGGLLQDFARQSGRAEAEAALSLLVRLRLAYPESAVPVALNEEQFA